MGSFFKMEVPSISLHANKVVDKDKKQYQCLFSVLIHINYNKKSPGYTRFPVLFQNILPSFSRRFLQGGKNLHCHPPCPTVNTLRSASASVFFLVLTPCDVQCIYCSLPWSTVSTLRYEAAGVVLLVMPHCELTLCGFLLINLHCP